MEVIFLLAVYYLWLILQALEAFDPVVVDKI